MTEAGSTRAYTDRWQATMMNNYGTPPLALVRGEGAEVWDADGRRYLDLLGGIAVNALGHAHPAVVEAVTRQVSTLGHTSNLYVNEPALALAEKLVELLGVPGARVLFGNSGAEANEAAFKIARRTGRPHVVAAENAFHGRTMGALALTGQPAKRAPFEPLVPGVSHVPYGDVDALDKAVDSDTAAVVLEPVMGEAGVVIPPDGYLRAARDITAERGALLVLDEVQTGIGRTGAWFAHQHAGIVPDVMTLAKGLGSGVPIGACLATGRAAGVFKPGNHGSTFGGNPLACVAALTTLEVIEADGLTARATTLGEAIRGGLRADLSGVAGFVEVRGDGLMIGVELDRPCADLVKRALAAGLLINVTAEKVVRLLPPLVMSDAEGAELVAMLVPLIKEFLAA